jgi:uncharacterized damage-inducible protein DinB
MKLEERLAAENVRHLDQGIDLLLRLDDAEYAAAPDELFRGGVGAQFRHCLDFYGCFLAGLSQRTVDYSARQRDKRIETSREHAMDTAKHHRERLLAIEAADANEALLVRSEDRSPCPGAPDWSGSTVGRELQFLVSHTIHHYALIAAVLKLQGHDVRHVFPEFGVAPSTLSHWKEADLLAPGR